MAVIMIQREIDALFMQLGYRFLPSNLKDAGIYYKYYQEGFHVVLAMDVSTGKIITAEQHKAMVERMLSGFYQPNSILKDFPDGFPVYHVEALTLFVGEDAEILKQLCTECMNAWAYLLPQRRLLIYENQPGDFFGLKEAVETLGTFAPGTGAVGTGAAVENGQRGLHARLQNWLWVKCGVRVGEYIPYVTIGLILVNAIVYLVMEMIGDTQDGMFVAAFGGLYPTLVTEGQQWWRFLTAGFIHFGAAHLVNNMLLLYCMGSRLERVAGHIRMLVIYVVSLLGGSCLSLAMMLYTKDYAVSAGASGAVYGVIGAFLWLVILYRGRLQGISAKGLIFMILLMIYYGVTSSGIDNWGHIGGLLTGFLITMILCHRKSQKY